MGRVGVWGVFRGCWVCAGAQPPATGFWPAWGTEVLPRQTYSVAPTSANRTTSSSALMGTGRLGPKDRVGRLSGGNSLRSLKAPFEGRSPALSLGSSTRNGDSCGPFESLRGRLPGPVGPRHLSFQRVDGRLARFSGSNGPSAPILHSGPVQQIRLESTQRPKEMSSCGVRALLPVKGEGRVELEGWRRWEGTGVEVGRSGSERVGAVEVG